MELTVSMKRRQFLKAGGLAVGAGQGGCVLRQPRRGAVRARHAPRPRRDGASRIGTNAAPPLTARLGANPDSGIDGKQESTGENKTGMYGEA
jgi:hypothetical protein